MRWPRDSGGSVEEGDRSQYSSIDIDEVTMRCHGRTDGISNIMCRSNNHHKHNSNRLPKAVGDELMARGDSMLAVGFSAGFPETGKITLLD
mmetsp:Transcript_84576/g.141358  ORF Transcript_84576/g.141358 Transcript_84576/m.141358 type:complete len:91 (-) Transcript_84576:1-273(-)